MLKTTATLLLIIPALSASAWAQTQAPTPPESARVKFIDMSEMHVSSTLSKAPALYVSVDERERFGKLMRLKRSVMPKMKASAKDVALR